MTDGPFHAAVTTASHRAALSRPSARGNAATSEAHDPVWPAARAITRFGIAALGPAPITDRPASQPAADAKPGRWAPEQAAKRNGARREEEPGSWICDDFGCGYALRWWHRHWGEEEARRVFLTCRARIGRPRSAGGESYAAARSFPKMALVSVAVALTVKVTWAVPRGPISRQRNGPFGAASAKCTPHLAAPRCGRRAEGLAPDEPRGDRRGQAARPVVADAQVCWARQVKRFNVSAIASGIRGLTAGSSCADASARSPRFVRPIVPAEHRCLSRCVDREPGEATAGGDRPGPLPRSPRNRSVVLDGGLAPILGQWMSSGE